MVEIQWYRCKPGAEVLGWQSAITSQDWQSMPWAHRGARGEVFNAERTYRQAKPPRGADGRKVCGTEEDFRRGGLYLPDLPPLVFTQDGLCLCCDPVGGVEVGGEAILAPPRGVVIGGEALIYSSWFSSIAGGVILYGNGTPTHVLGDTYTVHGFDADPLDLRRVGDTDVWVSDDETTTLTVPVVLDDDRVVWALTVDGVTDPWVVDTATWDGTGGISFDFHSTVPHFVFVTSAT